MAGPTVTALAGLVLLVGCSSDAGTPSNLPPLTASPSLLTSTPSPLPAELTANDAFGASNFTKYWFKVLNEAFESNSVAELRVLSDDACESCQSLIGGIESIAQKGHRVEGLAYKLTAAEATPPEGGRALVDIAWTITASTEYNSSGAVVDRGAASGLLRGQMLLSRLDDGWLVVGLRTVSP